MSKSIKKLFSFIRRISYRLSNPTALIFLYHRVDAIKNDPHFLSVSPSNFRRQLEYIKNTYEVVPLKVLVDNLRNGKSIEKQVAITFDDGYVDNLFNALPILEELKVPATIFITSGMVNSKKVFDWDNAINSKDAGRALTIDELKLLSKSKYIEIGAHTVSHPKLSLLNEAQQKRELQDSKYSLEQFVGIEIKGFSYPFGALDDFNRETKSIVKKCGFDYACANIRERVKINSDIFALPRFVVRDWTVSKLKLEIFKV